LTETAEVAVSQIIREDVNNIGRALHCIKGGNAQKDQGQEGSHGKSVIQSQAQGCANRKTRTSTERDYDFKMTIMKCRLFFLLILFSVTTLQAELQVGTGKIDISPEMGVPLDGAISQNGVVEKIHDPLHVRALVFSDGKKKVALAVVDNTMISDAIFDAAKVIIEKETGIPGSHAILAETHSHSTPRGVIGLVDDEKFDAYLDSLPRSIADAVIEADKSLVAGSVGWGSVDAPEHVYNRRWFVEESGKRANPFGKTGEKVSMNPGRTGLIKPAGPVDPELFLLSVRSADGKPVAAMGNYGLHYVGGITGRNVSADYFGVFSELLGEKLGAGEDFLGIMSNGTSGDVNNNDLTAERKKYPPFEKMTLVATALVEKAVPALHAMEHQSDVGIDGVETVLKLKVRKPDAALIAWAKENAAPENSPLRKTRPQVYARENLKLAEYPDTVDVRIQAVRIGDLGIVGIPNEVFAETGLAIKEASPFKNTFVMELANGYHGYLPSAQQHEWGGYETWPARSSNLEVNAEEKIRKAALELLEQLKK